MAVFPIRVLVSAMNMASSLSRFRNQETGAHMERMSRYARLIAEALADRWSLSDEFVDFLFMLTPLHDIGKIAVPDAVLLKRGPLNVPVR